MRRSILRCAVAVLLVGVACGTKTTLSNLWRSESWAGGGMQRILVIGVAETTAVRRSFEDAFATALEERKVDVVPSYELLPGNDRLSKESIEAAIAGRGIEGVVVTRLIEVDEQTTYVPPASYARSNYYGSGLYGYYGRTWDVVHTPGYTVSTTVVRLETHLYDAATATLVWAAHSDTFDPESSEDATDSVTKKLSSQLAADGVL